MPIYEYICETCGNVSEYLELSGNDEPVKCRKCGSTRMNRILSASSFTMQPSRREPGRTCCGREERCDIPPCSRGESCNRE